jgi:hypothetical protein
MQQKSAAAGVAKSKRPRVVAVSRTVLPTQRATGVPFESPGDRGELT